MFTTKKYILSIEEKTLSVFRVTGRSHPVIKKLVSTSWTRENFVPDLKKIRKITGKKISVLISDQFIYTTSIHIPIKDTTNLPEVILRQAQSLIPENLYETAWDYKEVLQVENTHTKKTDKIFQVIALEQSLFLNLQKSFTKMDFHLEAIESTSLSISRMIHDTSKTTVVLYMAPKPLLILLHKGLIVSTYTVQNELTLQLIEQFIQLNKTNYNIIPEVVIFSGEQLPFPQDQLKSEGRTVVIKKLDPVVGLALKTNTSTKDNRSVNITLSSLRTPETIDVKQSKHETPNTKDSNEQPLKSKQKTVVSIIIIIIVLLGLTGFYLYKEKMKTIIPAKQQTTVVAVNPTGIPTPTSSDAGVSPSAIRSQYTIEILNGSGREGEAGKLREQLTAEGFVVDAVGNADDSEHLKTEIRYKKQIDKEYILLLDNYLETLYSTIRGEEVTPDNEADVIIVVGIQ